MKRLKKAGISMAKSDQREYHTVILGVLLHDEGKRDRIEKRSKYA